MDQASGGGDAAGTPSTSTRPYLIRALHEWCTDNGFTPYIAVQVDRMVQVPMEYVSNNEIVLNVGFDATSGLELGNDFIQFKARFGGVAREIVVPIDHVVAIYARENGQGMAFPAPNAEAAPAAPAPAPRAATPLRSLRLADTGGAEAEADESKTASEAEPDGGGDEPSGGGRPTLKRIK
ncbi:ClpXP protease specificity-enhancing factor [Paucibacter sp. APW11]|uniref:ClpXP protease specificity-enhancing factor n=1 Tax=Roseateles aquae TaxID=3077235 RepID=A0ABU3PHB6_9BURK|nr:ClpXP protease specificity-enhancing factor [Paucibacter sp. APW11]MDT9001411.1 ClpXP protease specificity-enhancing factor [Paucibacter sp. APW11]